MSDEASHLNDLYEEVILDHCKNPRNFKALPEANRKAEGYNPLCGDKVTVYLKLESGVVQDISFEGIGCAISTAAASLMTETLKGKNLTEVETLFQAFHDLVTAHPRPLVYCALSRYNGHLQGRPSAQRENRRLTAIVAAELRATPA